MPISPKNRKIITNNKLNKSYKDGISNIIGKNIKEKELRITNSHIKVHILYLSILSNLSFVNFIKQNLTLSPIVPISDLTKYDSQSFSC